MCEHKEVSTFSGIQFQYPRQIIQKGGRHPNIPALFKPRVPGEADSGKRRDFFTPEAWRPAPGSAGQPDVGR
ncbi:putative transmembrane efflux protein [Raoultella ornithinolytica]|jgi:hypothetical protein|nr:putative transmembrane efflux protein [Raoultella ornithinolytica]KDV94287.1 DNA-binding domain protein [Raoultella ornithinolytica 2-156-04_S1_C1]KDX14513.1 DNA-binding domain protein [Raoultella ornithinolytica 2-156-04_S1_C2]BDA54799.1 hypothetical protein NUITMVR1_24580 [Raoultella ornithinolytica]